MGSLRVVEKSAKRNGMLWGPTKLSFTQLTGSAAKSYRYPPKMCNFFPFFCKTTQELETGRYLSRLWSDFQNSFVWWKLVKIVIDFYFITDFLSFIVWPLHVAEETKVSRVNFFEQKIQNFQFLATNKLCTSNESWNYVEFKFIKKK